MKKLISVFLVAVMISAVCFSISVSAANSVTNSLPEQIAQLSYSVKDYCKDAYATESANANLMTLLAPSRFFAFAPIVY